MDQLKEDMREIKADLKELIKQGAVHNILLQTHEARSLELQARQDILAKELSPIKKHVDFVNLLGKTTLAIVTGVAIYVVSRLLL
jgi:hypothetical protein